MAYRRNTLKRRSKKPIKLKFLGWERVKFLKAKSKALPKYAKPLEKYLLSLAGYFALISTEESPLEIKQILTRGEVFEGEAKRRVGGRSSDCHANCCKFFTKNIQNTIVTGYALSDDGIWRQHSWLINPSGQLIETTLPRLLYFGYKMTPEEAVFFASSNLREEFLPILESPKYREFQNLILKIARNQGVDLGALS